MRVQGSPVILLPVGRTHIPATPPAPSSTAVHFVLMASVQSCLIGSQPNCIVRSTPARSLALRVMSATAASGEDIGPLPHPATRITAKAIRIVIGRYHARKI